MDPTSAGFDQALMTITFEDLSQALDRVPQVRQGVVMGEWGGKRSVSRYSIRTVMRCALFYFIRSYD